jgi:hypothetical protein
MRKHQGVFGLVVTVVALSLAALEAAAASHEVTFFYGDGGSEAVSEIESGRTTRTLGPGAARTLRGTIIPIGGLMRDRGLGTEGVSDLTATVVTNPDGCGDPTITFDGFDFVCEWDLSCFDFGEFVTLCITYTKGEISVDKAGLFDSEDKEIFEPKVDVGPPLEDCKKVEVPEIDCSGAYASPDELWPLSKRLVPISIRGVKSPSGNPVVISFISVSQDEPVMGKGYGITCPDGKLTRRGLLKLRAEAGRKGNGRVYAITYMASDGKSSCKGVVEVCAPRDVAFGKKCIDDGQKYNTFVLCKLLDLGSDDPFDDGISAPSDDTDIRTPEFFVIDSRVQFSVPVDSHVMIGIYDVAGRRVKTLVNGPMSAGPHQVSWDVGGLPNGMYFYRMVVDGVQASKKLLLVK